MPPDPDQNTVVLLINRRPKDDDTLQTKKNDLPPAMRISA